MAIVAVREPVGYGTNYDSTDGRAGDRMALAGSAGGEGREREAREQAGKSGHVTPPVCAGAVGGTAPGSAGKGARVVRRLPLRGTYGGLH